MAKKYCYIVEVFLLILLLCGCGANELKESNAKNSSVEKIQNREHADETDTSSSEKEILFSLL